MALVKIERVRFATDESMATITNTSGSKFRLALEALLQQVAAGVIANDPTIVEAAEAAVAAAVEAMGLDRQYVNQKTLRSPVVRYEVPFVMSNGKVIGGIYDDGTVEFAKLASGDPDPGGDETPPAGGAAAVEGQTVSSIHRVSCIGDSLTQGFSDGTYWPEADAWPAKLDTNAVVSNVGEAGMTVDEVAIRIGALPLVLQAGVTVPTSGSVGITVQSGIGWRPQRDWTFRGRLDGIAGTLARTGTAMTSMTFTPDSGQGARSVPAGAEFVGTDADAWDLMILGVGRNNIGYNVRGTAVTVSAHVQAGIKRIVDWLAPQRKRFIVWGCTNSTNESAGSTNHNLAVTINSWCASKYPLNYVDVRSWLVKQAIYDMGITPTAGDLLAMSEDRPPASVMDDTTHFSKATATALAAKFSIELDRRDWKVY